MKSLEVWKKTFMMIFSSFLIFSLAAACSSKNEEEETECEANQEKNAEGECVDKKEDDPEAEAAKATVSGDDFVVSSDATKTAKDVTDVTYTVKLGGQDVGDATAYKLSVAEEKVTFVGAASAGVKDALEKAFDAVTASNKYEDKLVFTAKVGAAGSEVDKTAEFSGNVLHAYAVAVGVEAETAKEAFGEDAEPADNADLAAAFNDIVEGLEQKADE